MIWFPNSQLLSSPLLKIPLLFTAAKLAALGMTPPNPPASAEEMDRYKDGKDDPLRPFVAITDVYKVREWQLNAYIHIRRSPSVRREHRQASTG